MKMIMVEPKEPTKMSEPSYPEEFSKIENDVFKHFVSNKEYTIDNIINMLPPNIKSNDIRLKFSTGGALDIYYISFQKNKFFESQLRNYKANMTKYLKSIPKWEAEVKQYLKDVDQYLDWAKKENYHINIKKYEQIKLKYIDFKETK
jgi:hypothetical protein